MVDRNNGKAWKKKNVALHQINFALATSKLRLFIGNDKPGSLMLSKEKHYWLGLIDKWKKNRNKQRRRPKTDAIIIYQDNGWPKFGTKWKAGLLKTASAISTDRTNEFYDKTDDWVLCDWPRRVHYWQMELNLRKEKSWASETFLIYDGNLSTPSVLNERVNQRKLAIITISNVSRVFNNYKRIMRQTS